MNQSTMPDAAIDSQQEHDPSRNDLASLLFKEFANPERPQARWLVERVLGAATC